MDKQTAVCTHKGKLVNNKIKGVAIYKTVCIDLKNIRLNDKKARHMKFLTLWVYAFKGHKQAKLKLVGEIRITVAFQWCTFSRRKH